MVFCELMLTLPAAGIVPLTITFPAPKRMPPVMSPTRGPGTLIRAYGHLYIAGGVDGFQESAGHQASSLASSSSSCLSSPLRLRLLVSAWRTDSRTALPWCLVLMYWESIPSVKPAMQHSTFIPGSHPFLHSHQGCIHCRARSYEDVILLPVTTIYEIPRPPTSASMIASWGPPVGRRRVRDCPSSTASTAIAGACLGHTEGAPMHLP